MRVLVGSYQDEISAVDSQGEIVRRISAAAPSFLVAHPFLSFVYAVSELSEGAVLAFRLDDDLTLNPVGQLPTGGSEPCHLSVSPNGRFLACANYGSGSVAVFALLPDGGLDRLTDLVQHSGSGPNHDRQEGPHAHEAVIGDDAVSVVDLGTDRIVHYGLSPDGTLSQSGVTRCEPGSGPRHFLRHPVSGQYFVTNELASTVSTFDKDFRLVRSQPATLQAPDGENLPSELVLSPDARYLYVANRGNNSIVTFEVGGAGLVPVDERPCGGDWPRHMVFEEGMLLVANQRSGSVTALAIDPDSGIPSPAIVGTQIPTPACILPA